MAVFPPAQILLGTEGGGVMVSPETVLAATALTSGQSANSFANGTDRRTFLMMENTSGARRGIYVDIVETYVARYTPRAFNALAGSLFTPFLRLGVTIETAETVILGPFDPRYFNQADGTVKFGIVSDSGGWGYYAGSITGVKVGAFYLPTVDLVTGSISSPPEASDPPLAPPLAISTLYRVIPTGLLKSSISFTGHTTIEGWNLTQRPSNGLSDGMRRFVWIRNTTGSTQSIRLHGTSLPPWVSPLSAGDSVVALLGPSAFSISNNQTLFAGPFPSSFYTYNAAGVDLWISEFAMALNNANLNIAYLELPA